MITVEEATSRILAAFSALPPENVPLSQGLARVLAEDVVAQRTQPPFDGSAMDGYAVRASDVAKVPVVLTQIGESAAGRAFDGKVGKGETVRIFTGAPLPKGADAIVIQENTEAEGDQVKILEPSAKGRHIRLAGIDFVEGTTGIKAGTRLTGRHIALAAAMNVPWLSVHRKPRVAILSTGDELVKPGEALGESQIINAVSPGLASHLEAWGAVPIDLGIASDDAESLKQLAAGGRGADLMITIGGASVGDHDLVQSVLGDVGLNVDFWRIAMRPGKPLIFGALGDVPMIGLPGNPVSALVCATLFVKPAISVMEGLAPEAAVQFATAVLASDLKANDERQDHLRASLRAGPDGDVAEVFEKQDSSVLSVFAEADCLIIRPPNSPAAKAGEQVPVLLLD